MSKRTKLVRAGGILAAVIGGCALARFLLHEPADYSSPSIVDDLIRRLYSRARDRMELRDRGELLP